MDEAVGERIMNNTQIENLRQIRHILDHTVIQLERERQAARDIGDDDRAEQLCDQSGELTMCISKLRFLTNDIALNS
jgi:hypothetical protein